MMPVHFPRHVCRGLIEAVASAAKAVHGVNTFRGMFAAASLKPGGSTGQLSPWAHFPRHVCRGLIEAGTTIVDNGARWLTFRGMFAAASLKREHRRLDRFVQAELSAACLPRPH